MEAEYRRVRLLAPDIGATAPDGDQAPRWELGVGAGASLAGTDLAPAAVLSAALARGWLGVGVRALVGGRRSTALPDGAARWWRGVLAVGPEARLDGGRVSGTIHVGAGASWLSIDGRGYAPGRHHDAVLLALEGAFRVGWARRGAQPWLELGTAFWPGGSVVYQQPDGGTRPLPRYELSLTLGMSLGRR